ncbi:hypothetical protein DRP53_08830 [candidate division WOR-3 bacterium]|uniref:PASTA domain-containing protein n=1 Tax=candidate division WOR-3 bacterium TaxID=2052148 RepID=A0A660SGY3_UNCW3|nr:MAG: hypothetical protein DRP53_08830 [candidate division WOR-3 bacterium]
MRRFLIGLALLLFIFALGLLVFNFLIMPRLVKGKEVPVPDLIGKTITDAKRIVAENNLNLYIESHRPDPVYPESVIIIQDPLPGSYVVIGRQISVVVSTGIERIRIPDLAGLQLEKGMIILKNRGLRVAVESIPSDTPAGFILTTDPPPDSLVRIKSRVLVMVSSGPEFVMPLVEGKTLSEALDLLKDLEINLKVDSAEATGDTNLIILQFPDAGTRLHPGDSVRLLVAR